MTSGAALVAGMGISLLFGNPFSGLTRVWTPLLLQVSIVGLGAGTNLAVLAAVGVQGIGYTFAGILFTLLLGSFLGKIFRVERDTSLLIASGTAICGGSAIAAVATTIRANSSVVAVALATVFILNSVALFVFPAVGHYFGLTQYQFGLWSALAIHDTSSVVGASLAFGPEALEVATTLKLARALWIIPLAAVIAFLRAKGGEAVAARAPAAKKPWFILGFVLVSALVTWIPALQPSGLVVAAGARRCLVLTLFLIGANVSRSTLRDVGFRPFVQGLLLWLVVAGATLAAILLLQSP